MTVADLHKTQLALELFFVLPAESAQRKRPHHSSLHHAVRTGTRPRHTLQKASPVDSVMVVVILDNTVRTCQR